MTHRTTFSALRGLALALCLFGSCLASASRANPLDQDHWVDESGPHFYGSLCCFCKKVRSITETEEGFIFSLIDGRDKFVEPHMIRSSPNADQWYCPSIEGTKRCGLVYFGT
ncbi:MAG: hypothetical protein OIF48_05090 [Silicimonas sp.]|nr:hypothetical protein [Silicimonas sp.]